MFKRDYFQTCCDNNIPLALHFYTSFVDLDEISWSGFSVCSSSDYVITLHRNRQSSEQVEKESTCYLLLSLHFQTAGRQVERWDMT